MAAAQDKCGSLLFVGEKAEFSGRKREQINIGLIYQLPAQCSGISSKKATKAAKSLEDIGEDGQISGQKRFFFGFFQKITCLKVCGVLN